MSFLSDTNRVKDAAGFGPIQTGGVVNTRYATFAYTDTTAKLMFTLPQGAVIVGWTTNVDTLFNSSGTDYLDIGDGTTANRFADNLDLSAAGQLVVGYDDDELYTPLAEETGIYATFVQGVADASAGHATLAVHFILP
jgi:hypothetical protein